MIMIARRVQWPCEFFELPLLVLVVVVVVVVGVLVTSSRVPFASVSNCDYFVSAISLSYSSSSLRVIFAAETCFGTNVSMCEHSTLLCDVLKCSAIIKYVI